MPDASLYLDRVEIERYLTSEECRNCGADSCKELVEKLRRGERVPGDLRALADGRVRALRTALGEDLPVVPSLQLPRPVDPALMEINDPAPGAPVLVTGNSAFTQEVLLAVLSTTVSPFFVLFSDTRGDTLDMALILGSFTPERLERSLGELGARERAATGTLVLPGLAGPLEKRIRGVWDGAVETGPVCAAELPLYFGEGWAPAG